MVEFLIVLFLAWQSPVSILDGPTVNHAPVSILDGPQTNHSPVAILD